MGDQEARRALEGEVKREALRVERFLVLQGGTKTEAADALRVNRRSLQNWERREGGSLEVALARGEGMAAPRGPPPSFRVARFCALAVAFHSGSPQIFCAPDMGW